MSKSNKKSMNTLFSRNRVKQAVPDDFWPMPSELIGLEIEVENFGSDYDDASMYLYPEWVRHNDGSLRNGVEWVLSGPMAGADLRRAIDKFFDKNYAYDMGVRTSTHIHINAADDLTVDQFRNMFALMFLIEPAVFRWADEDRKWCGYCQPLTDLAPARLVQILNEDSYDEAFINAVKGSSNADRYYGLNLAAFSRHGTMEFRYFPCTDRKENMVKWVQFVMETKKVALSCDNPTELLHNFLSPTSISTFIQRYMTNSYGPILAGLDIEETIKRANRLLALIDADPSQTQATARHKTGRALSNKGVQKVLAGVFQSSGLSEVKEKTAFTTLEEILTGTERFEAVASRAPTTTEEWVSRYNELAAREQARRVAMEARASRTIRTNTQGQAVSGDSWMQYRAANVYDAPISTRVPPPSPFDAAYDGSGTDNL